MSASVVLGAQWNEVGHICSAAKIPECNVMWLALGHRHVTVGHGTGCVHRFKSSPLMPSCKSTRPTHIKNYAIISQNNGNDFGFTGNTPNCFDWNIDVGARVDKGMFMHARLKCLEIDDDADVGPTVRRCDGRSRISIGIDNEGAQTKRSKLIGRSRFTVNSSFSKESLNCIL
jgi:hypothetical protein